MISDLLGWIGDADEVEHMDDEGHLEGLIQYHKNIEFGEDPEDDVAVEVINEQGAKALKVYREWKAKNAKGPVATDTILLSVAAREYLETDPYDPAKTTRDCELSLSQFQDFTGDIVLTDDKAKVLHSLRRNFKDMLRDAGVSKEVNDFITGHASGGVAGNYGSGRA